MLQRMQNNLKAVFLTLLCGIALLAGILHANAQVSFEGKTIDVILGSSPGGGTDGTSRLVGSFLEKYLPGNPQMRYRNIPGGHGAKALNYFADVKPDGLTWAGGSYSYTEPSSLRKSVVKYDPTKFHYFGGVSRGGSVVFIRKEKLADLTDHSKPEVIVGVIDGTRSWEQGILFGKEGLNWNVRFVVGYPGTSFMLLAVQRGETHMEGTANLSLLREMLASGNYLPVAQLGGVQDDGKVAHRSNFENFPTFATLMKGTFSGVAAKAFDFWSKLSVIDKWYALPPGTPEEIVRVYEDAWSKIAKDPEFIKQGKSLFSADFAALTGAEQADLIDKTAYPNSEILAYMTELRRKHGLPEEPLSEQELAALAKEKGLDKTNVPAIQVVLDKVGKAGREIEFMIEGTTRKLGLSSSRTKVSIAGQTATRSELKPGMNCSVEFIGDAKEASGIACK